MEGKKRNNNKIEMPKATTQVPPKPTSADIPKAPSSIPHTDPLVDVSKLPTPEQLQADVQDKVNQKIAEAIVQSTNAERTAAFDPNFINELSKGTLDDFVGNNNNNNNVSQPPSVPKAKKSVTSAMGPPKQSSSSAAPASDKYTSLVSKYVRYYNTRRTAHPEISWVDPIQFQRMREDDQLFLYNQIYSAENSLMVTPTAMKAVLMETAKWMSAVSRIMVAKGVLDPRFDIGAEATGKKSFAQNIEDMIKSGSADADFEQMWCEFAGFFETTGPHWRLGMKTIGALGASFPTKDTIPSLAKEPVNETLKKKMAEKEF